MLNCWAWWHIGRFDAFCPKGCGFQSRSIRYVVACGTLAWNFNTVSVLCRDRLSSGSGLEKAL